MELLAHLDSAIKDGPIHAAKDMLRIIVADHQKSEIRAGVFKRAQGRPGDPFYIAAGECAYCAGGVDTPLLREEAGRLNGVLMHVHEDPNPSCIECAEAEHDDEPWPCEFLLRIAEHYEVEL